MLTAFLLVSAIFLAYTNGANDNFKGVATLYGSGTVSYKTAISIATVATFLGSVCAIFLAQALVTSFSGKGLVPQAVAESTGFLVAVGLSAGCTVLLATRLGFPVSTTHGLVGGLLGAGVMAVGWDVNFARLNGAFLIPLLVSPLIALALGALAYRSFTHARRVLGVSKESCVCVGEKKQPVPLRSLSYATSADTGMIREGNLGYAPALTVADISDCKELYTGRVWGMSTQKLLDSAHVISAATVSFARGLNDTPKIAGLLVIVQTIEIYTGMIAIAIGMAIGGLLNARKVAETMSKKITTISHGQGFSANFVTGFLVIVASKFGVPVSTTHVSVGSIFGIGLANGNADTKVVRNILLSWIVTLPVAMVISGFLYWVIGNL